MNEAVPEDEECAQTEVTRDALRRRLRVQEFERLRSQIIPLAEANGFYAEEDVFKTVS